MGEKENTFLYKAWDRDDVLDAMKGSGHHCIFTDFTIQDYIETGMD